MELKRGYKQTEIGVIPEEWQSKRLGDIASITSGGTPSRTNPKYWDGDIPWATTAEVDFYTINRTEQFITKDGLNNSAAKLLPRGTLLMALYGQGKTRGKVGILGIEAATNQACAAISLSRSVSPEFIFLFLSSQYETVRKLSNSGSQENLNSSIVRSIPILLPPLPEQRLIAVALSDTDALIRSLDQLITKKRDIKQAAMQQLLTGKRRLPGFSGVWEEKRLGELVQIVSGATPRTNNPANWDGGIKWCTPTDITGTPGKYLNETERTISQTGLSSSSSQLLPPGTLLLCSRATIGEVRIALDYIATNQGFKSLICGTSIHNEFLYYLLLTMKPKMIEKAIGSTFLEISKKETASLEILLPSIIEQTAIATVLFDMDAEITALEVRREKTRFLKQGMMQELLTGRIRLV